MAKTEDPFIRKAAAFEEMISSPKGYKQKSIKFLFRLFSLPLIPLSKLFPLSLGADYGRIWHIQDKQGFRKAVEFGCERLKKYLVKLNKPKPFFKMLNQLGRQSTWMLFARTIDYAYWDPRPEDEATFTAIAESLGIESEGLEVSETFRAMARFTWLRDKKEETWQWVERAVRADKDNAEALYLKGWFEIQLDKGNPVETLSAAVAKDPDLLRKMRDDSGITKFPEFMAAIEARARQAGLYVV